jgi:hypothetical protein
MFNIKESGSFRNEVGRSNTGRNIPHLAKPLEETASEIDMSVSGLQKLPLPIPIPAVTSSSTDSRRLTPVTSPPSNSNLPAVTTSR